MSEIVEYFFDAYFHQDWRDDYTSSLEGVKAFVKDEPAESKNELKTALQELRKQSDLSQETINKLGGNFKPESEGMDMAEWINKSLDILD